MQMTLVYLYLFLRRTSLGILKEVCRYNGLLTKVTKPFLSKCTCVLRLCTVLYNFELGVFSSPNCLFELSPNNE